MAVSAEEFTTALQEVVHTDGARLPSRLRRLLGFAATSTGSLDIYDAVLSQYGTGDCPRFESALMVAVPSVLHTRALKALHAIGVEDANIYAQTAENGSRWVQVLTCTDDPLFKQIIAKRQLTYDLSLLVSTVSSSDRQIQ